MNTPRGACPALFTPMQTGDGLLARIVPAEAITPAAFVRFCEAARRHGNGTIEISARGSLQARGLSPQSAPLFASEVDELGVAAHGVPIITDPLADDPTSLVDAAAIASALRVAIEDAALTLAPKVSVIVDGGGRLHLDGLTADVRLRAIGTRSGPRLHLAVAGDAVTARSLGTIAVAGAVDAVMEILRLIAARGDARAADVVRADGFTAFGNIAGLQQDAAGPEPRPAVEAIGLHPLRDDRFALGVALSFGHAGAGALADLAHAASARGAGVVRPAPGRVLLLIGLRHADALALASEAEQLGLIVRSDDPRRRIVACPGKPACASGLIASRMIAAEIAQRIALGRTLNPRPEEPGPQGQASRRTATGDAVPLGHSSRRSAYGAPQDEARGNLPASGTTIHISGCRKGCAHPAPAELTIVGTERGCGVIRHGSARALPRSYVEAANVACEIACLAQQKNEPVHA